MDLLDRTQTHEDRTATLALLTAARSLDAVRVHQILSGQLVSQPFSQMADQWLMPALDRVGEAWRDGELDVAGEHLIASQLRAQLGMLIQPCTEPTLVMGLLPTAQHELGLLSFAVAASQAGMGVCYLGADVPMSSWQRAVQTLSPHMVVTAVSDAVALAHLSDLRDICEASGVLLGLGGRLQNDAPPGCLRLGHLIGPAVRKVAERLLPARD